MSVEKREVVVCTCSVCGQSWLPKRCAACKSPLWNGEEDKRGKRVSRVKKQKVAEAQPIEQTIMLESTAKGLSDYKPLRAEHPGKCPHHKQRGELCYKCDHKFGLPKIGA